MRSRRIFRRARVEASARSLVLAVDASEDAVERFLDGLKYDDKGLVAAIAQDVDTGAILMQGFASREAVAYTLRNRKATFWSRSRSELWCKGETSGNFIGVESVHVDCDDSLNMPPSSLCAAQRLTWRLIHARTCAQTQPDRVSVSSEPES